MINFQNKDLEKGKIDLTHVNVKFSTLNAETFCEFVLGKEEINITWKGLSFSSLFFRNMRSPRRSQIYSDEDDVDPIWVPLKPLKNRYLNKMKRIAKHLDNQVI